MPLVVPGVTNQDASGKSIEQQWQEKLMGKKLGEASDTTVSSKLAINADLLNAKADWVDIRKEGST